MQRYFVPASQFQGNLIRITGDDVHHITRVMRFNNGDKIICNSNEGRSAICQIKQMASDEVQAIVETWLEENTELPFHITIAQGIPKGDKFDLILQKGTELGANAFIPFQAERSIAIWDQKKAEKKHKRFEKIIKEASEQSHRNKVPDMKKAMSLEVLIEESQNYHVKLFAYEEEAKVSNPNTFGNIVSRFEPEQNVLICIGPEGGFSEKEVSILKENDFYPVRLGPRILRTETAALYALASISYHFEEMRCSECQQ
ncbi:16S rRNA (uracil(1498)-N(3))-methyltransferase [Oceanobacillus sp. FSL K6-2867]|uniref:16S rRNA (uracil(1498)-N(3))-methyltransferase n=1 Tax=Oceanobacillus sp. FSL K6-2867 TaxID=2954748 RepID=UPI0030DC6A5B